MLCKAFGHDNRNLSAGDLLLEGQGRIRCVFGHHHAQNTAEMIGMRMGNHDRFHGIAAQVFLNQRHGRLSRLHAHGRVEHNPAGFALDDREVCHVITTNLVDALADLKQTVGMVVARVFPQAGIDGIRRLFMVIKEAVRRLTPHHFAVRIGQFKRFRRVDQAAHSVVVFACILKIKKRIHGRIDLCRVAAGALFLSSQPQFGRHPLRQSTGKQQHGSKNHCSNAFHKQTSYYYIEWRTIPH